MELVIDLFLMENKALFLLPLNTAPLTFIELPSIAFLGMKGWSIVKIKTHQQNSMILEKNEKHLAITDFMT